jgi:hypothetical protein
LTENNKGLQTKVISASQLKAEYVKVGSYKKKGSGKYVESTLAKRTNKLEVCMTIMDNKIADKGEKLVHVVITEPTGKVLAGFSKAEFKDVNGDTKNSTGSQKIDYNGDKQNLCVGYESEERVLTPGTYVIDIYVEGTLVANTTYNLK